jgi:hypothetical protein
MSAQMAKDKIRTFMSRLYPLKSEGIDYRMPSITMLLRWRRLLEPVCHFIALSAMDQAHLVHVLSDACTKRHAGVFHVNVKIEVSRPTSAPSPPLDLSFISALLSFSFWLCFRRYLVLVYVLVFVYYIFGLCMSLLRFLCLGHFYLCLCFIFPIQVISDFGEVHQDIPLNSRFPPTPSLASPLL